MSEVNDSLVAALVARALGLESRPESFSLDGWGRADRHWSLDGQRHLFIEVETSQRHPTTNVLKYWPWIEERPDVRVILVHAFVEPIGISPNRIRLAQWIGDRMATQSPDRCWYRRIVVREERITEGIGELLIAWGSLLRCD